jgi:endo-1,4-beta-D-glucanase Y
MFGLLLFCSSLISAAPNRPFPQHISYARGTIHPTNFTQAKQDNHVARFYNYWDENYLKQAGTNAARKTLYRVAKGKNMVPNAKCGNASQDHTVSEGQGYGMVIVALMAGPDPDAQSKFDGLWYFSREHPSSIGSNLMSWCIKKHLIFQSPNSLFKAVEGNDSAFDGDADIAYALLLAHEQWGSGGDINYQDEANKVLNDILTFTIGSESHLPKLGDWVEDPCELNNEGICESQHTQYTPRSSDFMPAHFRAFARATNNSQWNTIVVESQAAIDSIQNNHSTVTGLLPDFITNCDSNCTPAEPNFLEDITDGDYSYNAGRTPWRIGSDALLNNDPKSKKEALKMINWLAASTSNKVKNIKSGYKLDGTVIGNYSSSFFIAPFGVASMLDVNHQNFLNDIYAFLYNHHEDYYEDTVNLLSLLVITGNYWNPSPINGIDTDGDDILDAADNCTLISNSAQRDTDNDGFGNVCDADLNNDGSVSFADLDLFKSAFGTNNTDADLDGNGSVSFNDLNIFRALFGKAPGPKGEL